jgi:phenylpropionate dioxygenase-like ring-hydroxylating dioxygenase large terminal subunit
MTSSPPAPPDGTAIWIDNTTTELGRAWYAVALSAELGRDPLLVRLLGTEWVLVRLDGEVRAFLDCCPHRLYPLSAGAVCDGVLRCGYHGWEFDGDGHCTRIPSMEPSSAISARSHLTTPADVEERFGVVWLAPEDPVTPLPSFPEWADPSFEVRIDSPRRLRAGTGQIMDNSCDTTHFLMVHAGTFGGEQTAATYPRRVDRDGWTITAEYETEYRVLDDPHGPAEGRVWPSRQTKRFHVGAALELRMEFPHDGSTFSILIAVQPEGPDSSRVYRWFARDDMGGDEERWQETFRVEQEIVDEDVAALEHFRDLRLPLDLRQEVHVAADRLSLAYRRLLLDLYRHDPERQTADAPEGSESDDDRSPNPEPNPQDDLTGATHV